jgi:hypothetical protein
VCALPLLLTFDQNFADDFSTHAAAASRVSLVGLREEAAALQRSLARAQAVAQTPATCGAFAAFCRCVERKGERRETKERERGGG